MSLLMRLREACEDLPGPISRACVTPAGACAATDAPANGAVDLADEQLLDAGLGAFGRASTLATTGKASGPIRSAFERARRTTVGGGRHERAVEGRAHLERDGLALLLGRTSALARATAAARPAMTICPGALKFAGLTTSPLLSLRMRPARRAPRAGPGRRP